MLTENISVLESKIAGFLHQCFGLRETDDGCFVGEIYADYRDELDEKTAGEILKSDDPELKFEEQLDEWYGMSVYDELDNLATQTVEAIEKDLAAYPNGLSQEEKEYVEGYIRDNVFFDLPRDHFLDQDLCVNIMVDTGDGNYDYSLNSVFPCWYGREGDRIDDKASIVWLARQQGYTKTQLWKALKDGDMADPKGFLQSMRVELANLPSHMATLTFLVKMSFRQLLELNKAIAMQDANGRVYDATKRQNCGYIVLGKETECGLYDPWSGGGSVLEIQLEKDVRLPIRFIRCALPDEGGYAYEYSIGSVYGLCGSAWTNTLKEIHIPRKLKEAV